MLEAVWDTVPGLYPFVRSAYKKPSSLFCGQHSLQSAEEVQQGDILVVLSDDSPPGALFEIQVQSFLLG